MRTYIWAQRGSDSPNATVKKNVTGHLKIFLCTSDLNPGIRVIPMSNSATHTEMKDTTDNVDTVISIYPSAEMLSSARQGSTRIA